MKLRVAIMVSALLMAMLVIPGNAYGSSNIIEVSSNSETSMLVAAAPASDAAGQVSLHEDLLQHAARTVQGGQQAFQDLSDKTLLYDPTLIDQIGSQELTGHSTCCPSFACAYGDAVIDGTVHDHSWYNCWSCLWPNWGGGDSFNRYLGSEQELLREAYDQILAGYPTVVHVQANTGEHWICLMGYEDVSDPDDLSLGNFIALDPWDGEQVNAADRFELHDDLCEHVSGR